MTLTTLESQMLSEEHITLRDAAKNCDIYLCPMRAPGAVK